MANNTEKTIRLIKDDWEEDTSPEAPNAVTNAVLLRSIKKLEATFDAGFGKLSRSVRWLAVSVAALALAGFVLHWMR